MRMKGQEQPLFSPPGSRVHGVLYKIEEDQLRRLHKGLWGYELQQVEVSTEIVGALLITVSTSMRGCSRQA